MTEQPADLPKKPYIGFVWIGDDPGIRVSLHASTSTEAVALVKAEYGDDVVGSIRNEDDANRAR